MSCLEKKPVLPSERPGQHFNPRSPRGERQDGGMTWSNSYVFQSTLPTRRATRLARLTGLSVSVSIHAPHAESDTSTTAACASSFVFQSTLPTRRATPTSAHNVY